MPFVNIDLHRGKSKEYLEGVSNAVHEALVEGLGMVPEDRFQVINQHEPGELVFPRNFRGGPRSDDFIIFTITDGWNRGEERKRALYQALVRNLAENPGVNPADVFVMLVVTPPENYSFADGLIGSEVAAREALDRQATASESGQRRAYTKVEMVEAITQLFQGRDRSRILPMLTDDFVLKMPVSMPYGGEFKGRDEFDNFFRRVVEGDFYEYFTTSLQRIIEAGDQLIAQIHIDAKGKTTGKSMSIENAWVFDISGEQLTIGPTGSSAGSGAMVTKVGNLVQAQIYADTAAGMKTAG